MQATHQINPDIIHSCAYKDAEMQKANEALLKAKSLNRKVRRAFPGEGEFSKEIIQIKKDLESEIVTVIQASKILNTSKTGVMEYKKTGSLPFEKIKGVLYFKRSDVVKLINNNIDTSNLLSVKEAADYINMKLESFQHRKKKFNIPYVLKGKRNRFYRREDLDQNLIDHPRRNMEI